MRDLISRQAAIDALDSEYKCTDRTDDWDGLKLAILIIEQLPSVQPRKGKWIEDSPLVKKCSNSKCGYHDFDWRTKNYNFCPNCGCRMEEGEQDGNK